MCAVLEGIFNLSSKETKVNTLLFLIWCTKGNASTPTNSSPVEIIKTLGSLDSSQFSVSTGGTVGNTTTTSAYTSYFDIFVPITGSSGTALGSTVYSDATLTTILTLPGILDPSFATSTVTLNNGSTLPTFNSDLISWVKATVTNTAHLYNASCSATTGTCFAYNGGIYQYGCITTSGTSIATGATSGYTTHVITNTLGTMDCLNTQIVIVVVVGRTVVCRTNYITD